MKSGISRTELCSFLQTVTGSHRKDMMWDYGNCAMFAIALSRFLGGTMTTQFCRLHPLWRYLGEDVILTERVLHVAVKYRGWLFDGRGGGSVRTVMRPYVLDAMKHEGMRTTVCCTTAEPRWYRGLLLHTKPPAGGAHWREWEKFLRHQWQVWQR